MIQQIELSNFKCFTSLKLPLAPLTLLSGLNNSGKSSILQALRMIVSYNETADPTLTEHGGVETTRSDKSDKKSSISIKITDANSLFYELIFSEHDAYLNNTPDFLVPLTSYLCAERWGPRNFLPLYAKMGELKDVGCHGEYVLDFLERHQLNSIPKRLKHVSSEGDTLEYNVRGWLSEIAPNVVFRQEVFKRMDVAQATFNSHRPANVGFGLSYALPVIVLLLGMAADWGDETPTARHKFRHGALVMIENPEAHLHPKGQVAMGRLIALTAACGEQVIVETHSDHIMDGIRIAVKQGLLSAAKTAFHYFAIEDGKHRVQSPTLRDNGKLEYWPEGFFDQTVKSMAILARRD